MYLARGRLHRYYPTLALITMFLQINSVKMDDSSHEKLWCMRGDLLADCARAHSVPTVTYEDQVSIIFKLFYVF